MRSRFALFALAAVILMVPIAAHAAIPFLGPIIPPANSTCPAGWGMLVDVINNIISFLITIAIIFVAPLMIAWAGFLYVINPAIPEKRQEANKILWHTVIGIVIALAGWLIVNAIMVVLYKPSADGFNGKAWWELVTSGGAAACLPQAGALNPARPPGAGGVAVVPPGPGGPGKFTYQAGISAQVKHASGPLAELLFCMANRVPAGVGEISSISDSRIISNEKNFSQCAAGGQGAGCAHGANSCHYGGKTCVGSSYAVDFGDEKNAAILTAAARACGANYIGNEGKHLHVSVGAKCGCN